MSDRALYLTTPIYYVNALPHLGHASTTIMADATCRYRRLLGERVYFLTGTDEHGDKIAQAASAAGVTPLWYAGEIYFGEYGGNYCFGCERFYTDKEIVDGKCPDHQTPLTFIKEKNYFFRMSRYQDWLIGHLEAHPDFIQPERYRNEVLGFLREPLLDLSISRPKSRLQWGIPLPFDENYVTYVWFDALVNYYSAVVDKGLWPANFNLIGKDILVPPHAVYWPIMLHACGLPPPKGLLVHGWWLQSGAKMSKSTGEAV